MEYAKTFDPDRAAPAPAPSIGPAGGDTRDGLVYLWSEEIVLSVNIALATARPLLVAGPPGSGKSSLAPNVARVLGRPFRQEFITSRTQARDLQWRFDLLRRLRDAQAGDLKPDAAYVSPGILWSAFVDEQPSVVLLDEIDKADPDVPDSLLMALGALAFQVEETGEPVEVPDGRDPPLVILTTNDERELSKPFLRRCVLLTLGHPGAQELARIAGAHGLSNPARLHERVAEIVDELRARAKAAGRRQPSTAEYLDAVRACLQLNVRPDTEEWRSIERAILSKQLDAAVAGS